METLYFVCFLFGALFSGASFLLAQVNLGHVAHGHHAHHGHDDRWGLGLLNLPVMLAFLTWFGAAGYLLQMAGVDPVLSLAPSAAVGFGAGYLIARLFAKVRAGERTLDPADYRLPGTIGHLTVGIPAGGVGEIVFVKAGSRRSEAARSSDGVALAHGTEVVILGYERGVATVQPWDEFYRGKEETQS